MICDLETIGLKTQRSLYKLKNFRGHGKLDTMMQLILLTIKPLTLNRIVKWRAKL